MAVLDTLMAKIMPGLSEAVGKMQMGRQQRDETPHAREGTLYRAGESGRTRGRGNTNAADAAQAKRSNLRAA